MTNRHHSADVLDFSELGLSKKNIAEGFADVDINGRNNKANTGGNRDNNNGDDDNGGSNNRCLAAKWGIFRFVGLCLIALLCLCCAYALKGNKTDGGHQRYVLFPTLDLFRQPRGNTSEDNSIARIISRLRFFPSSFSSFVFCQS